MKKYILASASPRRRELLGLLDIDFDIIVSECDENIDEKNPVSYVCELSKRKCLAVVNELEQSNGDEESHIVIGADTIVVLDDVILGKPEDEQDAYEMLSSLSGNTHKVYTGVTVHDTGSGKEETFFESTSVTMYELERSEINAYIATGEPMDKAGAYGIQGRGSVLIKKIDGDYFTVVGLPVGRLHQELKKFNI